MRRDFATVAGAIAARRRLPRPSRSRPARRQGCDSNCASRRNDAGGSPGSRRRRSRPDRRRSRRTRHRPPIGRRGSAVRVRHQKEEQCGGRRPTACSLQRAGCREERSGEGRDHPQRRRTPKNQAARRRVQPELPETLEEAPVVPRCNQPTPVGSGWEAGVRSVATGAARPLSWRPFLTMRKQPGADGACGVVVRAPARGRGRSGSPRRRSRPNPFPRNACRSACRP